MAAFVLSAVFPSAGSAQSPDLDPQTGGFTYIIAYPDTTTNTFDSRFIHQRFTDGVWVYIYSPIDSRVTITPTSGSARSYNLTGGKFATIELTGPDGFPDPIVTKSNQAVDNTFRIESIDPVVVYCSMLTGFGAESWTPLPVSAWGTEYYAAAMMGEIGSDLSPGGENTFVRKNKAFPSEILIIAAKNGTSVTITHSGQLQGSPPTVIMLQAGQAYQVQSAVDTLLAHEGNPLYQTDLGGSRVSSDKPVAVISGNTRGQIVDDNTGFGKNAFKNMMIEWVRPTTLHGREFVYMPTWDARRLLGTPNENRNGRRCCEFVRVYSTDSLQTGGTVTDPVNSGTYPFITNSQPAGSPGTFYEDRVTVPLARAYRTYGRTQAFMNSPGIVKNNTDPGGGIISGNYSAWAGFMTELIPREQWGSFAPYIAPLVPALMEHTINVVADTASQYTIYDQSGARFNFNRGAIPGTDLVWGTQVIPAGESRFLEGRNGARFSAVLYGSYQGYELYRPGSARRDGSPVTAAALHPSEMEETLGLAYGMPLTSRVLPVPRSTLPDSLKIETVPGPCGVFTVRIWSLKDSLGPVGLRQIALADTSANARITIKTDSAGNILTDPLEVTIIPLKAHLDASGPLIIKDRIGRVTVVPYTYLAARVAVAPSSGIALQNLKPNIPVDTAVTILNPVPPTVVVQSIRLASGTQGFSITGMSLQPPVAAGQSVTVRLRAVPLLANTDYRDTLVVSLECDTFRLYLSMHSGVAGVPGGDAALPHLLLIPNPVVSVVKIRSDYPGQAVLELVDAGGATVHREETRGSAVAEVPTADIPSGLYTVLLKRPDGQILARGSLVVVH